MNIQQAADIRAGIKWALKEQDCYTVLVRPTSRLAKRAHHEHWERHLARKRLVWKLCGSEFPN